MTLVVSETLKKAPKESLKIITSTQKITSKTAKEIIEEVGKEIKIAVKKKLENVDDFMKTPDFQKLLNDAWSRYKGKLPKDKWTERYKTLYRNKEKGAITEEKFKELMRGNPISLNAGSLGQRNIDNFLNGIAREIKSGLLKSDNFTKKQIQKDIYLLLNPTSGVKKIEWHLFNGADDNITEILKSARERLGTDKFDFIIY